MRKRDLEDISRGRSLAASGRLRSIRQAARISRSEMAAAIGVTPGAVTHYESGRRQPTGKVAIRIARTLDGLREQVRSS